MLEKETYSQLFKCLFQKNKSHTGMVPSKSMGKGRGSGFKIVFNEKILWRDLLNNASLTLGKPTWIAN